MDSINTKMSAPELIKTDAEVNRFNKVNEKMTGIKNKQQMGKDEFLTLLIAQLSHQDPTNPMDNTEFVAQMAQFSSLEQVSSMSSSFSKMAAFINSSEAAATLGKTVELDIGDTNVQGIVEGATRGENPQVLVNGMYYSMDKIRAIYAD